MSARLYLDDPHLREFTATVVACEDGACVLSATAFHPGGGGQPQDLGELTIHGEPVAIAAIHEDEGGRIWHAIGRDVPIGTLVRGVIDWPNRHALMRHHALMHIVNT